MDATISYEGIDLGGNAASTSDRSGQVARAEPEPEPQKKRNRSSLDDDEDDGDDEEDALNEEHGNPGTIQGQAHAGDTGNGEASGGVRVITDQERFLPIANVTRVMRNVLPLEQAKIAKDARELMQECVSEYIQFFTSEAADRCLKEKRKTLNGEDILFAVSQLGLDDYVEPLKLYLQKYREITKTDPRQQAEEDQIANKGRKMPSTAQSLVNTSGSFLLTYETAPTGSAPDVVAQTAFRN